MKKIILISCIFCATFSCSKKNDLLTCDCTYLKENTVPISCNGNICQSDTCQTYIVVWKDIFLTRNQMTTDFFDNHITICDANINKYADGISYGISYKVLIDWSEVKLSDQMTIQLSSETTGMYPTLSLPRNTLLTKDQINSEADIMAFGTTVNSVSSINKLKFNSLQDAKKALIKASGIDTLCRSEIYYEQPNISIPPTGDPFLRYFGVINWVDNHCITSQMNLYTGEVNVTFGQCYIVN